MRRRALVVAAVVVAALAGTSDQLAACGDKFLRPGRSPRLSNYASIHPSAILVYQPAQPDAKGIEAFRTLLKRAGHTPVFVTHGTDVAPVAASASYALVIANYAEAAAIKEQLRSLPGRPDVLPILNKPSKAVAAQAAQEYHCLLTPHNMTERDALEEIDHALAVRLKGITEPGSSK